MSIATDVSRIKGNITAALAAIADKGVTVPDGSTSDALAGLIASIEAGGGSLIAAGSITPASNGAITITHNFGDGYNTRNKIVGKTTIIIIAASNSNISSGVYSICSIGKGYKPDEPAGFNSFTRWGKGFIHTTSPTISSITNESFRINNSNESYPFVAGNTYHYAIWDNGTWKG